MGNETPKQSIMSKFVRILGMVMSFLYIIIGVGLLTKSIDLGIEANFNKILGIGLLIYGAFRFYRALKGGLPGIDK